MLTSKSMDFSSGQDQPLDWSGGCASGYKLKTHRGWAYGLADVGISLVGLYT